MNGCKLNNNLLWRIGSKVLLLLLMIYPVCVYCAKSSAGLSYIFTSVIFALPVIAFSLLCSKRWLYCILVSLLTIFSIIELTMVDLYGGFLQPGNIISTLWTDQREASEFYQTNLHEVWKWIPLVLLCIAACWTYRPLKITKKVYAISIAILLAIPSLFCTYKLTCYYRNDSRTLRYYLNNIVWNRPPYNVVYASIRAHHILEQRKLIELAANVHFGAHRDSVPACKEIYVLGIGESMRYENLSLNGHYPRTTTPRLEALDNIILYDNYYSQACLTMFSVPQIITRATPSNFELNYAERSIIEPYRECGFSTYTIVNNNLLSYEQYLSAGCDYLINVSSDIEVAYVIDSLVKRHDKLFILCQFLGNHHFYTNYDKAHDIYHPNSHDPGVGSSHEAVANAYDNTVLYADYVLSSIIDAIDVEDALSAMMFVSDHGEIIGVGHGGNCAPTKEEYHVPYIFWWSDSYAELHSSFITCARNNKCAKLNGDNIFYSVCALADIQLDSAYSEPFWNILSPDFQEHERLILLPDGSSTIFPMD